MCGDKYFNARLLHPSAMSSFRLELSPTRPLQKFPNISRLFPGLRSLYMGDTSCSQCFHDTMCVPLTYLPSSLERLELSFWEVETWFLTSPSGRPSSNYSSSPPSIYPFSNASVAGTCFPHLRTLILNGTSSSRPFRWNLPTLAPNLETLILHTAHGISAEHILQLLSSITELRLPRNTTIHPWNYHLLPPSLTALQLNDRIMGSEPPQETSIQEAFRGLPTTLLQIELTWDYRLPMDIAGCLPRSLTSLIVVSPGSEFTLEWALLLPRQLRILRVLSSEWSVTFPTALLSGLPQQLEVLSGLNYTTSSTAAHFENLPPTLTELDVVTRGNSSKVDGAELSTRLATLQDLKKLSFACMITNGKKLVDALPVSLRHLTLHLHLGMSPAPLPSLNFAYLENLERIELHFSRSNVGYSVETLPHLDWLTLPQKRLKEVSISGPAVYTAKTLERLLPKTLTALQFDPYNSHDFFNALPTTLLSLKIHSFSGPLDETMVASLPPRLRCLEMQNVRGFSGSFLASLPRSITSLHVASSDLMTVSSLKHLPPNLTSLSCSIGLMQEWQNSIRKPNVITI